MTWVGGYVRRYQPYSWSEIQLERNNRSQIAGAGVETTQRSDPQATTSVEEEAAPGQAFIDLPGRKSETLQILEIRRIPRRKDVTDICRHALPRRCWNTYRYLPGDGRPSQDQRRESRKHQAAQHQIEQGRAETGEKESTGTGLHPGNMPLASLPRCKRYL